jgi:hypothetical protein
MISSFGKLSSHQCHVSKALSHNKMSFELGLGLDLHAPCTGIAIMVFDLVADGIHIKSICVEKSLKHF